MGFREVALDSRAATPLLWHYGNVDGQASAVFLRPQAGVGVIVLQNLGGDMAGIASVTAVPTMFALTVSNSVACPTPPKHAPPALTYDG